MGLYKRGKWWHYQIIIEGERFRGATGTQNKRLAEKFLEQVRDKIYASNTLGVQLGKKLEEAMTEFLVDYDATRKEASNYAHDRKQVTLVFAWLIEAIGDLPLEKITRQLIHPHLINLLKTPRKPATVNNYIGKINRLFDKAHKDWLWMAHTVQIPYFQKDNKRVRFETKETITRLFNELAPPIRSVCMVALETGLRQSNVCNLKWAYVNFTDPQKPCISVPAEVMKNKRGLYVPLTDAAVNVIKSQIGLDPEYVFINNYGRVQHPEKVRRYFKSACRKIGLEDFKFHDLRHTWATWLRQKNVSTATLMALGNWSSHEMVLRYAHHGTDDLHKVYDTKSTTMDFDEELEPCITD